jgi:hypothetical protein
MLDSDIIEIISMISCDDLPVKQMSMYIEYIVDNFFKDPDLTGLSSCFNRLKTGISNLNFTNEDNIFIKREIIGYITECYEKKYGEEVALRVFMHLNLL